MSKYIKSHSNYVLKKKHQTINDGTIYERDITTIGGVNQFSRGQVPIYKSSNFIVTVRNDGQIGNQFNSTKWKENDNGETWTLQTISGMTSDLDEQNDVKIVLKQDYYDFRDFAYYGSLTELFRGSLTDIMQRFPGELYISPNNPIIYYTTSVTEDFEKVETSHQLGQENSRLVSNPFNINIHSKSKPLDANPLKYFINGGYTNYEVIYGNSEPKEIENYTVTYISDGCDINDGCYHFKFIGSDGTATREGEREINSVSDRRLLAIIEINVNGGDKITIEAWLGDNNEIFYLSTEESDIHIRPKETFLTDFYNECDNFEKLIVNRKTNYKSTFSVIKENEFGYYRELKDFVFPTTYGGYNIEPNENYINQMVKIGEYYDELFTDNLYRSMTHEAIKNFDWTYTREYNDGDEVEFVEGGKRIQKTIRLIAREFDEIKSYIDAIKNTNKVSYDERGNVPDYFLTDEVKTDGWDVKLVYPYDFINGSFSQNTKKEVIPYSISADSADNDTKYGYFISCCKGNLNVCGYDNSPYHFITAKGSGTTYYDSECGSNTTIRNRIKNYTDETPYTYVDINREFLRRLKINSRHILRHKGTIEGIEMILGMFGLKSKRWVEAQSGNCITDSLKYDYEILEYTSFAERIEEKWDAVHQKHRIDWVNSTKSIIYDNRNTSNYTKYGASEYNVSYQGIPVLYRDEVIEYPTKTITRSDGVKITTFDYNGTPTNQCYIKVSPLDINSNQSTTNNYNEAFKRIDENNAPVLRRYLYPNFDKYEQLDGNPYFQMNGGWLSKKTEGKYFQFDDNDNFVTSDKPIYKETIRNIRRVDNISSLLSLPKYELHDGIIVYVSSIEDNSMVIDGVIYKIQREYNGEGNNPLEYVEFIKKADYILVGDNKYYDETIVVYDKNGNESTYYIEDKPLGYTIKAYLNGNKFMCQSDTDGNYSINNYVILKKNSEDENMSNYYILDDVTFSHGITTSDNGWKRLKLTDDEYLKINTINNYYEGNNPHNGNMVYDNGYEYFTYFSRLFKHSIDNDLFDERCYEDYYYTAYNEIDNYGFKDIVDEDDNKKQYSLIIDSKIHYFGNYKSRSSDNKINGIYIYTTNKNKVDSYKNIYASLNNEVNEMLIKSYSINNNKGYRNFEHICNDGTSWGGKTANGGLIGDNNPYYSVCSSTSVDEITNQIVNNKKLTIKFVLHNKWSDNDNGKTELKYLDDIVMNYLTQMIPSTAIVDIEYNKR